MSGGPTVTLTFAGDADRLRRTFAQLGAASSKFNNDIDKVSKASALAFGGIAATAAGGALVAGAALAALPLAFAGIGIAAAAQSEKVKTAFTGLKTHVVAQVKQLAVPFEAVLVGIAAKAKAAFNQIAPDLGAIFKTVAPMVDTLATAIMNLVTGAMPGFRTAIESARPVIDALAAGITGLGPAIGAFFTNLSTGSTGAAGAVTTLFSAVNWLLPVLGSVIGFLAQWSSVIVPIAAGVAAAAAAVWVINGALAVYNAVTMAVRAATAAWAAVQWVLNAALFANPIGIVVVAIAALVAAVILAWRNCETFRNIVIAVWGGIKSAFSAGVAAVKGILSWFGSLGGLFQGWFSKAVSAVRSAASAIVSAARQLVSGTISAIAGLAMLPIRVIAYFVQMVTGGRVQANQLIALVRQVPGRILSALGNLGSLLVGAGRSLIQGLINGIKSAFGGAVAAVRSGMTMIRNLLPFSPAKEGPFSGRGYSLYSGQALIKDFGRGITRGAPDLQGAAESALRGTHAALNGSVATGRGSGVAAAGGGVLQLVVAPGSDAAVATMINHLIRVGKIQAKVA